MPPAIEVGLVLPSLMARMGPLATEGESSRRLMRELVEETVLANVEPESVKERKKQRKLSLELESLRGKIAAISDSETFCPSNREVRLLR